MPRDSLVTTDATGDFDERRIRTALVLGQVEDALEAIGALSPKRRRSVMLQATEAELLLASCEPEQAEELADRALRRADCPEAAARLRIVRALSRWERGSRASRVSLERICAAPLSRGVRAASHEALARMDRQRLDLGSAESALQQAWVLHVADESIEGMARVLGARAEIERERGRTFEALRFQERCLELSRATTRLDLQASAYCTYAELLVSVGEWSRAGANAEKGRALALLVGGARFATRAVRSVALVALARGDFEAARRSIDAVRSVSTGMRPLAEASLAASDLALAVGDSSAAVAAADEATRLSRLLRDEGSCRRAWVRKAQALVALGRYEAALECAARAAAGLPSGSPTRALASLARGRALLRLRRDDEARAVFGGVRAAAGEGEAGWRALAELGYALADGCRGGGRIAAALRSVEGWGERRMLSYGLSELRERVPEHTVSSAVRVAIDSPPETEALVRAVEALAGEGTWPERCVAAMGAVTQKLPWDMAAWLGDSTWQVARGSDSVREVPPDGLVRSLCEPGVHQLRASPTLRRHPEHVLLNLDEAFTARVSGGSLVILRGISRPPWSASQRGLACQLARVLGSSDVARCTSSAADGNVRASEPMAAIVGDCLAMKELRATLTRIAQSDVTVRVIGETGTGKELVAKAVHDLSPRFEREFVPFNSAAVQDELFESELFGHVKGAFTGAVSDRKGRVQAADGGTLFIDEVAELSPRGQAKLLRFLESGEYSRVGETHVCHADVRVVVATNADLERRVRDGRFREDLLYRMSDPEVTLPPLRERGDDLLVLAGHFLAELAAASGRPRQRLSPSVAGLLRRFRWPGNVRELRSALRSAVALAGPDPLETTHFHKRFRAAGPAASTRREIEASRERELIERTLDATGGNCTQAAARLRVTRQWFYRMRRRAGLLHREPSR